MSSKKRLTPILTYKVKLSLDTHFFSLNSLQLPFLLLFFFPFPCCVCNVLALVKAPGNLLLFPFLPNFFCSITHKCVTIHTFLPLSGFFSLFISLSFPLFPFFSFLPYFHYFFCFYFILESEKKKGISFVEV